MTKKPKGSRKKELSKEAQIKLKRDLLIAGFVFVFILGILEGYFFISDCPKVIVSDDHCCIDNNTNAICDNQENKTNVIVHARGEGDVVIVSGETFLETDDADAQVTTTTSSITTTSTSTTTSTTNTTTSTTTSTTDDHGYGEEDCDNIDLFIFRGIYNDGGDSNVEILMRNDGPFDIKRWRVKVYDDDNGLALQNRFYGRLNASMVEELGFEFGDNELVNAGNDVVRIRIAPMIDFEVCEEYSIHGDKLEVHN
jgi:hypothetical protein